MDRRAFHRSVLLTAISTPLVTAGPAHARPARGVPRRSVVEYGLPHAEQTHELVRVPGLPLVLVSQMSNSHLVKVRLDPAGEQVQAVRAHPLGEAHSMLHGLAVSQRHPGLVWATHEGDNRLLLVDPNGPDVDAPPRVLRTIDVPGGGQGPHYVGEYGDQLWVSLKTSNHVLSIDHADPSRFRLYEARPNPIFVARHPESGEFYASQDDASQVLRINPRTRDTAQLDVPDRPVGLVAGPVGLWVALLGTSDHGIGTFGRIDADGSTTWFRLRSSEVTDAGLLHIAFDPAGGPSAWLLGSSIVSDDVLDVVVRVTFDPDYTEVVGEEVTVLPTQHCKAHRLLPLSRSLLVTELTSSTLAQLTTESWDRPTDPAPGDPS
ncbi:hypothetical protein [Saccharothrix luteola]|uniref:hypothetical protein n=1 Tax=Saccharothrix luteola TaxID=2893018 RepID=UPI001E42D8CD|nr:hypothetical protein [Saccharothrix luteola]MCC8250412.1 hypothetical protein [Saccharothrix luteola]